jgi:ElaB/YqjD/DUF883 family membrane-anchored ribosome-binding protein
MNKLDQDQDAIDGAAARAHETVDRISEGAKRADRKIRSQAQRAEERMEEALADVREHSEELASSVSQFVKDNPMLSVGLAMAAGALLNTIFRSR